MDSALLVYGGLVWTGDENLPRAGAFLVEDGVFTVVGEREQVEIAARGKAARRIDARGSLVIPGISDAHMHLTAYCMNELYLDLSDTTSIGGLIERVKAEFAAKPDCRWLRAVGYNETTWAEPVSPTMRMLDDAAGGRPVLLSRYCGHVHVANRAALEESKLWESTDKNVVRGDDGEPTGILNESAAEPIIRIIRSENETPEKLRFLARDACARLASMGITAVHACGVPSYGLDEDLTIFQDMSDAGDIPVRVISYHDAPPNLPCRSGMGDRFVSYGGLKIFVDGNLGGFTSAMRGDFSDRARCRGQLIHTDEELFAIMREASARDIQMQMHMIGDAAIDQAIRTAQRLVAERGKPRRPIRFNHVIVAPPDMDTPLRELGVVLDIQPVQAFTDRVMAPARLGPERLNWTYPFRRLYDTGLLVTGSSDAPMENPNPWLGIWAAVCRTGENGEPILGNSRNEVLTLDEALAIYTRNPYRAILKGGRFGAIREGGWADFAILENNPFACGEQSLKDTMVRATYLEGRKTHGAED